MKASQRSPFSVTVSLTIGLAEKIIRDVGVTLGKLSIAPFKLQAMRTNRLLV